MFYDQNNYTGSCADGSPGTQTFASEGRMRKKHIAINHAGYRIGEGHHRAKLTDADVELILYLRDEGLSYQQIADKFDDGTPVSKSTVRDICQGRIRGQYAERYKVGV